jgi:hypothetical protein
VRPPSLIPRPASSLSPRLSSTLRLTEVDVVAYVLIWTQVEINKAIALASAPPLEPLVKALLGGSTFQQSTG